jgi:mycothiol system anti-sigma-R factor
MNCEETRRLLHAYLDGELDLVRSMEIQRHLEGCAGCMLAYQKQQSLRSLVRDGSLYYRAPEGLKNRIQVGLSRAEAQRIANESEAAAVTSWRPRQARWGRSMTWAATVAALAGLAFIISTLASRSSRPSQQDLLAEQVVSSHIRSLMPNHLTDVVSSDQHTVKPWFDGRLDFSPSVVDLARQGFPLVGGRLDYLGGRPVAALVYQRRKHLINVFTWPSGASAGDSGAPVKAPALQGYNVYHWTKSGMIYWAVSDLSDHELMDFAEVLRNAT